MNPVANPFAPGAGTRPPELAGRDELIDKARIAFERIRRGYLEKNLVLVGLRGVGKTVLLNQIQLDAEASGMHAVWIEAKEDQSLPGMLAPRLRQALLRLSRNDRSRDFAQKGLKALAGFIKALKVKYNDIELSCDYNPEPGLADSGDLESDMAELLEAAGEAARAGETALVLFIDELQYVQEAELAALITALHRMGQIGLPVTLVGAGLPQLRGRAGEAKSYAERLFDFPEIGPLSKNAACDAIRKPLVANGVAIDDDALDMIVERTHCYPYFLQEWGKHSWIEAASSPIRASDVSRASDIVIAALDASFFRVRFDRLTPLEKRYMRAMAELGPGPHRSGDITDFLGRKVTRLAPTRAKLIAKGMIWSPNHGDTAFTVPMFDEFMKRIMPRDDWKEE